MKVEIQQAEHSDLPDIGRITDLAYTPYIDIMGAPPVPMLDDHASRVMNKQMWKAVDATVVVGLIVLETQPDSLDIFSIAVDPAHHSQGIGRQLMQFAEHHARQLNKRRLNLYTNTLMTRNLDLYDRLGYQETGRRPNPRNPDFIIVDMSKTV